MRDSRGDGRVRAAGEELVAGAGELVQDQLEPQLVGLVDDDEQQLVVRVGRERALQAEQVVDQQVGGVVGAAGALRCGGGGGAAAGSGSASAPSGSASSAWLTSASAPAFCARGTERIDQRSKPRSASQRGGVQRLHVGVLDLVGAVDLLGDQLGVVDDLDLGGAERPRALEPEQQRRGTRRRCWWRVPIRSAASSSTSPSGEEITAAAAAGPGLPRAPPSTWTTTFTAARLGVRGERCEVAGHARAAPVAHLAHAAATAGLAALLLAAVDDDGHVGVILVVGGELVVELVRERFGNDAVDHGTDASHWTRRTTFDHPSSQDQEMQAAAIVGGGVGDLLLGGELGELVALRIAPHAARLVGEVDLVAVPARAPTSR